jgi:hypothetical protein
MNMDPSDRLTQIRVKGGEPTPEEAAAAVAVVEGMLREGGLIEEQSGTDDWEKSVRQTRQVVDRVTDSWGNGAR